MQTHHRDITVKQQYGTYKTNIVRGLNASCTAGERQAAERLGQKLYGESFLNAEMVSIGETIGATRWRLHAEPVYAWAWPSGLIQFGREAPEGAVKFATGIDTRLIEAVSTLARHGQGSGEGQLLVPGVPEATNQKKAMDALIAWVDWCAQRNGQGDDGVVFGRG